MAVDRKQSVLFLCTQNSARSQIAEGFLRHLAGDEFEAYSAGVSPTDEVHPHAVEAMAEVGVDISGQRPKGLGAYLGKRGFNYLVIVCERAEKECPKTFPGVGTRFSWIFDDPAEKECPKTFPGVGTRFSWIFDDPRAEDDLSEEESLERFRKIRDQIELKIEEFLDNPEEELKKLKEQRERERQERMARNG